MVYLKKLADTIKDAIGNKRTPQEILCSCVLWQFSEIQESLQTQIKKPCSVENFLSVYMRIEIKEVSTLLNKLAEYKDICGKEALQNCLYHRI